MANNQHSDFLKEIFKPENFKADELDLVLSQFKVVEFKKGETIIPLNTTANYYFFMESGYARSYAIDTEGNDVTTNFYQTKDIVIDWRSYFIKSPTQETIQALSKCKLHKIYFEDFMKLFKIEAFREVGRTRLVNNYFSLKSHTVSMITDLAKDRYLELLNKKPDIVMNVPLKLIASYLGVTDTSLSRIRKDIHNKK